jgi:hypothetical protein
MMIAFFEACLLVVFALAALGCVNFQQDPRTEGIYGHNKWNHYYLTKIC